MNRLKMLTILLLVVALGPVCLAQGNNNARIKKMEASMQQMQQELSSLKAAQQSSMMGDAPTIPGWTQNVFNFTGDLRYRYKQEDDSSTSQDRRRNAVRGRLTVFGSVNEEIDLVLRVGASEYLGDSGAGSSEYGNKNVVMEQMYVDWHPTTADKLPFLGVGVDLLENVSPFYYTKCRT